MSTLLAVSDTAHGFAHRPAVLLVVPIALGLLTVLGSYVAARCSA